MLQFFRLIRIRNLFFIILGLTLFYYLLIVPAHVNRLHTTLLPFGKFEFFLFVVSVVCVAAAGSIIYYFLDFEKDREYQPDSPLPQGSFSLDHAIYLHALFAFTGIGLGFYLGYRANYFKIGYVYIICVLLLYLYPAYLKKIPLAGNILVAALAGFVFVLLMLFEATFLNTISFEGANFVLNMLLWQLKFYGGFVFLLIMASAALNNIADKEGDEVYNVNSFAVQFGVTGAKLLAAAILLILGAGISFFISGFISANAVKEFLYALIFVVFPVLLSIVLLFLARERQQFERIDLLLNVVLLTGLLSIPVFYFLGK